MKMTIMAGVVPATCGALGFLLGNSFGSPVPERTGVDEHGHANSRSPVPAFSGVTRDFDEDVSTDQLLLKITAGDGWRASENRMQVLASVSAELAKSVGTLTAIHRLRSSLAASSLLAAEKQNALEVVFLSTFEVQQPAEHEIIEILRSAGDALVPMVRALPFFMKPRTISGIHARLGNLLTASGHALDAKLRKLMIMVAVDAAESVSLEELRNFSLEKGVAGEESTASIALALSRSDTHLALEFIGQQTAKDAARLARLVQSLQVPPALLQSFCASLTPPQRAEFVSQYLKTSTRQSPQVAADLAEAIPPSELPVDTRSQMIGELLRSGGGRVSNWLASLPMQERAKSLNEAGHMLKKRVPGPFAELSNDWLTSAIGTDGIDKKLYAAAARSAAWHVPLEKALSYANLAAIEDRAQIQSNAYSVEVNRHLNEGVPGVLRIFESVPAELRAEVSQRAILPLLVLKPDSAVELYAATSDPGVKTRMEDFMIAFPASGSIPLDKKTGWIQERLKDPRFSGQASSVLNSYIEQLRLKNPSTAIEFANSLPESKLKDAAIRDMARNWAYSDPASASEWVAEMPRGIARDGALTELIKASRDEPQISFVNATGITDNKLRMDAAAAVVNWWKNKDPKVIQELLTQSQLSSEDKQALMKLISQ